MKSLAVFNGGRLEIVDVPVPEINEFQALVKVLSCGVCNGTDTKIIHGNFKNFNTYPALLGHEAVGEVVKKGSKVVSFKEGDHVLLPFLDDIPGSYYSGWGGYSEYAVVNDIKALIENGRGPGTPGFPEGAYAQQVLPPEIDPVPGTMIVTFREVLSACKRFGFRPNESIVIFGAGPVGLCFTKFAKLLGLNPVITTDIVPEKVEEALKMGADYAFLSSAEVNEKIRELLPDGVDYVVDAVGVNSLINQAMELIKYNGKICCYGISPKLSMELDWSKAPYNWTLQFVQFPLKKEEAEAYSQVLAWIKAGALDPNDFISDVVDFDNIIEAFKMVEERRAKKKIVIRMNK